MMMQFLVVALVTNGALAVMPSQAQEYESLLIKCTPDYYDPSFGKRPPTMWFTTDLKWEMVKSWTHELEVGSGKHIKHSDRKTGSSDIEISDRLFDILITHLNIVDPVTFRKA